MVVRVIIVESSSPWDLMHGTSEKDSLEQICKMMGHNVASFFVKSKQFLNIFHQLIVLVMMSKSLYVFI